MQKHRLVERQAGAPHRFRGHRYPPTEKPQRNKILEPNLTYAEACRKKWEASAQSRVTEPEVLEPATSGFRLEYL